MNKKILLTVGIAGLAVAVVGVGFVSGSSDDSSEPVARATQSESSATPSPASSAAPVEVVSVTPMEPPAAPPAAAPLETPSETPSQLREGSEVAEVETIATDGRGVIPYTPGVVQEALARGETVMVDYFATW